MTPCREATTGSCSAWPRGSARPTACSRRAGRPGTRGGDVVIGYLEPHDRPETAALAEGLEVVPRLRAEHGGLELEEMDVDAVIARAPELALVDELAHTNARRHAQREALPGHRRDPRRRDRRDLDRQRPAPREPQRRDLRADRRPRPRDVPRPDPRRGRRGRARRPLARGAPGAPRGRQGLPRERAEAALAELLPHRQPRRAARARAARGRRGRRGAPDTRQCSSRSASRRSAERILALVEPQPQVAADPAPRLALGAAARRGDRRALGAARRASSRARRRRRSSPRCGASRASSAPTSSRSRATTSSTAVQRFVDRARLDLHLRRHARRVAPPRDLRRLAPLADGPRAARASTSASSPTGHARGAE